MSVKPTFFENFEAALAKLIEFESLYDGSEIHQAGVIQAFEFTFEQCWKAIQKKAGAEGLVLASPRKALEWAMTNGWILATSEGNWLQMLNDRNLTSHTYRARTAQSVTTHILAIYITEFKATLKLMKNS